MRDPLDAAAPRTTDHPAGDGVAGLDRRTLLGLVGAGVGGSAIGAAALSGGRALLGHRGRPSGVTVHVHGGADSSEGARDNALAVWRQSPAVRRSKLTADYDGGAGASSDAQAATLANALTEGKADVVVVDPEYLPGLVGRGLIHPVTAVTAQSLLDDGCFDGLVERCKVRDTLYALPLNADVPMLAVNQSLLPKGTDLQSIPAKPREFWTTILRTPTTVLIENANYEGLTVCLVELLDAFDATVHDDPTLARTDSRDALRELRELLREKAPRLTDGNAREADVKRSFEKGKTAFARLWPAQGHALATTGQEKAPLPLLLPVPGGVLGGQVLAVAARTRAHQASEELAVYLTQPFSQLQLFHNGGYLPVLRRLYTDTRVKTEYGQYEGRLGQESTRPSLRPSIRDYASWSETFRNRVNAYLTGGPSAADRFDEITEALDRYAGAP